MTLKKPREYCHPTVVRKYSSGQKKVSVKDKNGYEFLKEIYYRPTALTPWEKAKVEQAEYRAKAFAKPEPQAAEYYEGYDNCVKGVGF
jgi:hypothetical protein